MTKITLSRYLGDGTKVITENWKDLISALCLCGYEVYIQDENIIFKLGGEDIVDSDNTSV